MANSPISGLVALSAVSSIDQFVVDRGVGTFRIAGDVLVSTIGVQVGSAQTSALDAAVVSINSQVSLIENRISNVSTIAFQAQQDLTSNVSVLDARITSVANNSGGGGGTIQIQNNSSVVLSTVSVINFTNAAITVSGNTVNVSTLGGGGGGGTYEVNWPAYPPTTNEGSSFPGKGNVVSVINNVNIKAITAMPIALSVTEVEGYVLKLGSSNSVQEIFKASTVVNLNNTSAGRWFRWNFNPSVSVTSGERLYLMVWHQEPTTNNVRLDLAWNNGFSQFNTNQLGFGAHEEAGAVFQATTVTSAQTPNFALSGRKYSIGVVEERS